MSGKVGVFSVSKFERLVDAYTAYYDELAVYAFKLLQDYADTEDVMQTVVLRLMETSTKLPNVSNHRAFLYACVRYAAYSVLSKRPKQILVDSSLLEVTLEDKDDAISRFETEDFVREQLSEYPREYQDMFIMYVLDNCTPREIAEVTNIKPNTISQRIVRMKRKLLKKLTSQEDGQRGV